MEKYPAAISHTYFQHIFYPLVRSADVDLTLPETDFQGGLPTGSTRITLHGANKFFTLAIRPVQPLTSVFSKKQR